MTVARHILLGMRAGARAVDLYPKVSLNLSVPAPAIGVEVVEDHSGGSQEIIVPGLSIPTPTINWEEVLYSGSNREISMSALPVPAPVVGVAAEENHAIGESGSIEQLLSNTNYRFGDAPICSRIAQKLYSHPASFITKVSLLLSAAEPPATGNISVVLRRVSDDSIITTLGAIDASLLTDDPTWFDLVCSGSNPDEQDIRLSVEYPGPYVGHPGPGIYDLADVCPGQLEIYRAGAWEYVPYDLTFALYWDTCGSKKINPPALYVPAPAIGVTAELV